jgi:hypothetical protein
MRTHEDMIEIMKHLQRYDPAIHQRAEQHTPSINVTEVIQEDTFHTILFGGDQLTVAHARGSQRIQMNSHSATDRIQRLYPIVEDWHTT